LLRSPHQIIKTIYDEIALETLKAYMMVQFSYMVKTVFLISEKLHRHPEIFKQVIDFQETHRKKHQNSGEVLKQVSLNLRQKALTF
jgi:hypothetical protein